MVFVEFLEFLCRIAWIANIEMVFEDLDEEIPGIK